MSEEQNKWVYKADDIFQDIENDPDNVNMTIPPEVAHAADLKPGDKLKIKYGDQGTIIIEKVSDTKEKDE